MPKRTRRTLQVVPAAPPDASTPTPEDEPGAEATLLLLAAARANPLPRDEVIVRLGQLLRRDFNYKAYRRRNGMYTAYDELLEQSMEAVASAVFYLQEQGGTPP